MQSQFLTFPISLIFLIISANLLLRFIEKFAGKIKISPLIIGATIIAVGTSLPETFVAISSITQNATDIAMGDVIGSNISNICLILAIGMTFFPIRIGTQKTQRNNMVMFFVTLAFIAMFFIPPPLKRAVAILLIVSYVVFLVVETIWGEYGSKHEDKKSITKLPKSKGNAVFLLAGIGTSLGGLLISSHYLVSSVIYFSQLFNISEEVIGLSVVALGTSLPELATTLVSGIKGDWKLLFGDIQGSSIYNLALIGSILFLSGKVNYPISIYPLVFLVVTTISIIYLSRKYEGKYIPRYFGVLYLGLYVLYIAKIYTS